MAPQFKSIPSFPAADDRVSDTVSCEEFCERFPNHLFGEHLDAFIQWTWTAADIFSRLTPLAVQELRAAGISNGSGANHKRNAYNWIQKRLDARIKGHHGAVGIASLMTANKIRPAMKDGSDRFGANTLSGLYPNPRARTTRTFPNRRQAALRAGSTQSQDFAQTAASRDTKYIAADQLSISMSSTLDSSAISGIQVHQNHFAVPQESVVTEIENHYQPDVGRPGAQKTGDRSLTLQKTIFLLSSSQLTILSHTDFDWYEARMLHFWQAQTKAGMRLCARDPATCNADDTCRSSEVLMRMKGWTSNFEIGNCLAFNPQSREWNTWRKLIFGKIQEMFHAVLIDEPRLFDDIQAGDRVSFYAARDLAVKWAIEEQEARTKHLNDLLAMSTQAPHNCQGLVSLAINYKSNRVAKSAVGSCVLREPADMAGGTDRDARAAGKRPADEIDNEDQTLDLDNSHQSKRPRLSFRTSSVGCERISPHPPTNCEAVNPGDLMLTHPNVIDSSTLGNAETSSTTSNFMNDSELIDFDLPPLPRFEGDDDIFWFLDESIYELEETQC